MENLLQNKIVAILFSGTLFFINTFVVKLLYDKYYNYSNIENYKKGIKIPEEYISLKEEVFD